MTKAKNLIEAVQLGKSPVSLINEFLDDRDAIDAIMLVIRNESKFHDGLLKGSMKAAQVAKEGSQMYLKSLMDTIKDDVMDHSVQTGVQKEVERWIRDVQKGS